MQAKCKLNLSIYHRLCTSLSMIWTYNRNWSIPLCIIVLRGCVISRGLNKGKKKEIYFWNKAKIFSSFCLYWCMYFTMQNSRSLKEAFWSVLRRIDHVSVTMATIDRCKLQSSFASNSHFEFRDKPGNFFFNSDFLELDRAKIVMYTESKCLRSKSPSDWVNLQSLCTTNMKKSDGM